MSKLYPFFFETVNNSFEKIRAVWVSNYIPNLNKIRIRNTMLLKCLQTDMIVFDQFIVALSSIVTVKFFANNLIFIQPSTYPSKQPVQQYFNSRRIT